MWNYLPYLPYLALPVACDLYVIGVSMTPHMTLRLHECITSDKPVKTRKTGKSEQINTGKSGNILKIMDTQGKSRINIFSKCFKIIIP